MRISVHVSAPGGTCLRASGAVEVASSASLDSPAAAVAAAVVAVDANKRCGRGCAARLASSARSASTLGYSDVRDVRSKWRYSNSTSCRTRAMRYRTQPRSESAGIVPGASCRAESGALEIGGQPGA
eukprot:358445-Chlamydomonas_euryale.AAC.27